MDDVVRSVAQFQKEKLGNYSGPSYARIPYQSVAAGRKVKNNNILMVAEEASELVANLANDDIVGIADSVADLMYVLAGVAVTYGLPLGALFTEVHISNMKKEHDPTCADGGKPVRKPLGWKAPRIKLLLETVGGIKLK